MPGTAMRRCRPATTATSTGRRPRSTVLEAYGRFSPKLREVAEPFFAGGWIDAPVKFGKSSGAFAHPTVPSAHPYLMLNYLGKARDVMTLAHELGHGVHQVLAGPQGSILANTPLTLAETASVFGEMLTFRSMLDKTTDKQAALRHAVLQGRGHAQHGGAADCLLHLRATRPHRAAQGGRADHRAAQRRSGSMSRRRVWARESS